MPISFHLDTLPLVEWLDYMVDLFRFLRNLCTAFHSSFTNLHFYYLWIRDLVLLHLNQCLLFSDFCINATLIRVKWNLVVVFICIYLHFIASNHKHFFISLLSICISSCENCLFMSFIYFLTRLFIVFLNPLSAAYFANIFSHLVGFLFNLFMVFYSIETFLAQCNSSCLFLFNFLWLFFPPRSLCLYLCMFLF